MKRIGTISYNIYCNFTNYGSALQTWALHQAIKRVGYTPVLIDYCPDILADKDPLNPCKNMWDQNEEAFKMVELTLPAIRINFQKFSLFYRNKFDRTAIKYTSENFNNLLLNEKIDGFVCGSDTIFCPDEFGFDDGYYANYPIMKGKTVSYAASFGDPHFTENTYQILNNRIQNFKALGIRENQMIPYLKNYTCVPIKRVVDPTLLLESEDYETIVSDTKRNDGYLLLYSRRYSPKMDLYAEKIAKSRGLKILDISLHATNSERGHEMAYESGVEEFLSLVKNAEFVVTNSYHGAIFSILFRRQFVVFSREQSENKIKELLDLFGLSDRILITGEESYKKINYEDVHSKIIMMRQKSIEFLKMELELL